MVKKKTAKIKAVLDRERVLAEAKDLAKDLYDQSRFGEMKEGKLQYSLVEAFFLLEKGKLEIKEGRKKIKPEEFIKKAREVEPKFWVRYCVFRDLRQRGYIVKTALKFGADFRVYDRGVKPGEDHAKWIVFPVHETENMTMHEFAAKNRVAHSTKKRLLLAIVDGENECVFYEIRWIRP